MIWGWARASLGHPDDGLALIQQELRSLAETNARVGMTIYLSWLAEAQVLDGATSDALVTIEEALQANPEELAWWPDALRISGELRLKLGDAKAAEADFRESIALAKKMSAKGLALRPAISLARMLKARGEEADACDLLAPLYSSFTEGLDTADLKDAKALLEELSV